ncbi:MAG: choice-of-anchor J domain-containing protein, partial [Muribaculaceae bacterium]|nr:choice-of-anchor J domain-containing protein [Muribaculaceae bacterium]
VTDLEAKAAEKGVLEAVLTFKMPLVSISGAELDTATVITATAESNAGKASVTGKPGETVNVTVPTEQGDNIIKVTSSSEAGTGLTAEVLVYTGVYVPGKAIVDKTVSEDNMTMTLNIELDDYNENDEYVGPDECDVTIYRNINGEWRVAAEIGKNRTWTFESPAGAPQDLYQFGVAARNAVGYCEEMTTFGIHLGKVFTLPMAETWPTQGENVTITYEPVSLEHLSYYPAEWGFCDPADVDDAAANGGSTSLYATWESNTQALLPRFSTVGLHNVKLDLNMFFGDKTPESITVFASSPKVDMEPVATFTRNDGNGWEHKLISLPSTCQNQGWVQIIIRVDIKGYAQYFLLDSYSIADYPEDMVTITSFKGNTRAAAGDKLIYTAEIENAGTKTVNVPEYKFVILTDNGVAADLKATNAPEQIESKGKAKLTFEYTTKAADKGDMLARFSIEGQPKQSVSEAEINTTVINAMVPVVKDLKGTLTDDGGIALSWSKPLYTESFEAFEPWDYSEEMRGFRNLDLDGGKVWGINEMSYPGKGMAKAFQVFTGVSVDNPLLQAKSGDYYLACMSASKGVSDDWLISPEVKGGTEVSFYLTICDGNYPETVLMTYSTTGNNPEDFKDLANGYICPDEYGWNKYTFTLPEDAKYFALHHVGDDGNEQFGFMIDDLCYEPLEGAPTVEGYNLYRDQQLLASGLASPGYVDKDVDLSAPVMYTVKTLSTINGEKVESDRSNVLWTEDVSGVATVMSGVKGISAGKNRIYLTGFEAGSRYSVANAAGAVLFSGEISDARVTIPAAPGVYVVTCGKERAKVIVR